MTRNFKETTLPCPMCPSSDAFAIRVDGTGYCFSCQKNWYPEKKELDMSSLQFLKKEYRGISPDTLEKYGVKVRVDPDGEPYEIVMPRPDGTAQTRSFEGKRFGNEGEKGQGLALFGSDKFPAGSSQSITITEGYFDAMSSYQIQKSTYPVVGVQSASTAKTECAKAYDYLNSFDKIYIAFDADKAGRDATDKVSRLFDFNKVYVVNLDPELKDSNEYLKQGKSKEYMKTWWAARRFLPEGILASYSDFDSIIDKDDLKPSIPYPYQRLQDMTYGIRTGELVLFTAQEGIGKTEIFRSLEYHLLKSTEDNIGIIHLEENKARTIKGLVGYELQKPVHLPDFSVSKEDLKKTIREVSKTDERIHIYSHFGSDDPDVLLSTVRFMAGACGCKYIFLDHITMAVTGLQGEDERRALDYISTRLGMMVEELDFSLFLISHVNDNGQTRGSRNIGKIADLRIDLERDLTAEVEEVRNRTYMTVAKNRFSGKTGPGGVLAFSPETYVLTEYNEDEAPF